MQAPHFARSLEWLLFTSLEINADLMPSPSKLRAQAAKGGRPRATAGPLLTAAADLLRQFPQVLCSMYTLYSQLLVLHCRVSRWSGGSLCWSVEGSFKARVFM